MNENIRVIVSDRNQRNMQRFHEGFWFNHFFQAKRAGLSDDMAGAIADEKIRDAYNKIRAIRYEVILRNEKAVMLSRLMAGKISRGEYRIWLRTMIKMSYTKTS